METIHKRDPTNRHRMGSSIRGVKISTLACVKTYLDRINRLDANKDPNRSEFLQWHMQTTSKVWGQWNYSLSAGTTYKIVDLIQRSDLKTERAVVFVSVLRSGEAAMVWGGRRGDYRDP